MNNKDKIAEAQNILGMIEGVSPDDTDTLNEIDARVWCLRNSKIPYAGYDCTYVYGVCPDDQCEVRVTLVRLVNVYTTSLDAQQSIMPNGWAVGLVNSSMGDDAICELTIFRNDYEYTVSSPHLLTEPLARLHAIIQAYIWEWENDTE